jgi:hypothetical protein
MPQLPPAGASDGDSDTFQSLVREEAHRERRLRRYSALAKVLLTVVSLLAAAAANVVSAFGRDAAIKSTELVAAIGAVLLGFFLVLISAAVRSDLRPSASPADRRPSPGLEEFGRDIANQRAALRALRGREDGDG